MRSILIPAVKSLTVTNKPPDKSLNEDTITVGSNGKYDYYSYIFFDTSLISCNDIILKAELILFKADKFYNDVNKKISISPLKEYFSKYATYNNLPIYDRYTTISFYPLTSKVSISINITTIISSWVRNPKSNKGLILYDKIKNGILNFTSVNSDDKPFIIITYKDSSNNKSPKEKSNFIKKCDCCKECSCNKNCDCRNNCSCNKNCDYIDNCCCNKNCVSICKDELKAILTEVCNGACCNNCNPQSDSTVRQVRVTGTVAPLSVYFIVVSLEVTRAASGFTDNYYVSDQYDNSLSNNSLSIDKTYNIAIIPKIQPGDIENLTLSGSYKGPALI